MVNISKTTSGTQWGILATGKIAAKFATDLQLVPGAHLCAVGSRSITSAQNFAEQFDADRAYGSYDELAKDPDVDVIYVATPHGRHVEDVMTCFEAGKAVLCEKALTLCEKDTAFLIAEARKRGLFFAEAMWMRTNPNMRRIEEKLRDQACGQVRQVRAGLGFVAPPDSARLWDPALGASALLDVGIYPLTFANMVLGEPQSIRAAAVNSDRGIDINGGATLTYADGAVANIAWTQVAMADDRGAISGDSGRIEIPSRFHTPTGFTLTNNEGTQEFAEPVTGRGYAHEIEEVNSCLGEGATESKILRLDDTLSIMRQLDEIRSQISA